MDKATKLPNGEVPQVKGIEKQTLSLGMKDSLMQLALSRKGFSASRQAKGLAAAHLSGSELMGS